MNKNIILRITRSTYLHLHALFSILVSCGTMQTAVDSKDLSYLYNPTKNSINPRYNVTNQSDDQSVLSVKFFASELSFSEANPQGVPMAQMLITVKLFNTSRGRMLADTAFYNLNIIKEEGRPEYVYKIPSGLQPGLEYMAEVKILDRIRQKVVQAFVPFNTLSTTTTGTISWLRVILPKMSFSIR